MLSRFASGYDHRRTDYEKARSAGERSQHILHLIGEQERLHGLLQGGSMSFWVGSEVGEKTPMCRCQEDEAGGNNSALRCLPLALPVSSHTLARGSMSLSPSLAALALTT